MYDVVAIGEPVIDFVPLSDAAGNGELCYRAYPGGGAVNVLAEVCAMGGSGLLLGAVGQDLFGEFLTREIRARGIETREIHATGAKNTGIGFVHLAADGERLSLIHISKQLRQFGFTGLCFTKDLYQVDALQVAGAASNGMAFAYPYLTYTDINDCDDPMIKEFLQAYQDEYGTLPVSDCAYRAYDSMLVLQAAVEAAGTTEDVYKRQLHDRRAPGNVLCDPERPGR